MENLTDRISSASLPEQETVIRFSPGEDEVHIWTNYPAHVRHFSKDERYTLSKVDQDGAHFTIPRTEYNPVKAAKNRRNLTDEQKQALADRLAKSREHGND